ncbi:hypothetical protein [Microlunatus parietis]|uniref:Uncharacterized protein n=1 Tax=Microlunatus parietis TaxID=682979 RepID=A0A7Y9IAV7_9ACTN|nr:hypothetical protein [Microlunatus parietis]NYE73238.1 hypothetical protein [Microlunatus parietis]
MLDEEYRPDQIAEYGRAVQDAAVERMRPHLLLTRIGVAVAAAAVVLDAAALITFPVFAGSGTGPAAAVVALVAGILLLVVAGWQLVCWQLAFAEWRGGPDRNLNRLALISYVAHWVSYLLAVVALLAAMAASRESGWSSTSAVLTTLGLVCAIGGQVLAGVQYLRTAGPPGTIPAHMRRLIERERKRAERGR